MTKNPPKKPKDIYYRRAIWGGTQHPKTLEKYLREAFAKLDTVSKRTFLLGTGEEVRCADYLEEDHFVLLQIAACVPGQPTSTLSKKNDAKFSKITAEPAPAGKDYLDGDIFLLIKGDHIVMCPSGIREVMAAKYFRKILLTDNNDLTDFKVGKIAKSSKLQMIKEEGVSEISMGASLYEASRERLDKDHPSFSNIRKYFADQLEKIFANDLSLSEIREKENLNVCISIRFDGKEARKHSQDEEFGKVGKVRLAKTSESLIHNNEIEDGFTIITGKGNRINSGDVQIATRVNILTLGKSLSKDDAWEKLKQCAVQFEKSGFFAQ